MLVNVIFGCDENQIFFNVFFFFNHIWLCFRDFEGLFTMTSVCSSLDLGGKTRMQQEKRMQLRQRSVK